MATTVRKTMRQIAAESRNIRAMVHSTVSGSMTQGDQILRVLNQLLEQTYGQSREDGAYEGSPGQFKREIRPANGVSYGKTLGYATLIEVVGCILSTTREKQGVFGLSESKPITNALLALLVIVTRNQSLACPAETQPKSSRSCEMSIQNDVSDLRQTLVAAQSVLSCARMIAVNQPGRQLKLQHRNARPKVN